LPSNAPSPAIAPFDGAQAKQHQEAWAAHFGAPVEKEIDLGRDAPGNRVKLTLVLIPPGEFSMGSSAADQATFVKEALAANDRWAADRIASEGPQRRVRISKPFYLGKYEVSQSQWQTVMASNPSHVQDDSAQPVDSVSWADITRFLDKLNDEPSREGLDFYLPTEAQWEYACRAGTTTFWHCGNSGAELQEYAWFGMNSSGKPHPVGQLLPNEFGLYDMHGNVFEWCSDWMAFDGNAHSPTDDPGGSPTGSLRANRGGSWKYNAAICRSALRGSDLPDKSFDDLGFRVAATVAEREPPAKSAEPAKQE
jgi:formylglycine-generating enzyme required for sulfatase activity